MGEALATEWQSAGHDVRISTNTPLRDHEEISHLEILRQPTFVERLNSLRWADILFRNGNALRSLPAALLSGIPFVTRHARPLSKEYLGRLRSLLDKATTLFGMNVGTSRPVTESIPGPVVQIPNPVRALFRNDIEEDREGLLFAGRLVSRKGVDVALRALSHLHKQGCQIPLSICGDGKERASLEELASNLGLRDYVMFQGWTAPEELAELYGRSEVALIPSRKEPFGIVALEAIASGCPVVASEVGGLPEAIGDCGILVDPDRPKELADGIETALQPETRRALREAMPAHVDRHRIGRIAKKYTTLFNIMIRDTNG